MKSYGVKRQEKTDVFTKCCKKKKSKFLNPSVLAISEKPSQCWFLFYYKLQSKKCCCFNPTLGQIWTKSNIGL